MHTVVKARDLVSGSGRTAKFEGEAHGSGVSFYLVDNDPGQGPSLHRHPYSETWIVRSGTAIITAGTETIHAEAGDIVVVPAGTAHKFRNDGADRLELVCIHASPRMVQEDLEDDAAN